MRITVGGIANPALIKRTYDDIEQILRSNQILYKETETHTEAGTFKSFSIETR